MTRCRLYSQQINNFLSRQQCWPVCVGVSHRPPSRASPPSLLCTEGSCRSPQVPCPGLLPAVRNHHIQPSCDGRAVGASRWERRAGCELPVRVAGVAGKHVGWRGGTARLWEAALGFAACLAWWNRRASTRGDHRYTLPSVPACAGDAAAAQTQLVGRESRAPRLPQSAWHSTPRRYVSPKSVCTAVHARTSPCTCARRSLERPFARVRTSMAVPRVCPLRHRSRHLQRRHLSHNMASSIEEICWERSPFHPQHCVLFLIYIPRGGATGGRLFQLTARKAKKQDLTSCYSIRESEHSSPAAGCWQQRSHSPRRAQEKLLSAGKGLLPRHRGLRHGSQRRSQSPSVRLDASPPVHVPSWVHFLGKGLAVQSGRVVWGDSHGEQPGKEGKPRGCGAGGTAAQRLHPG